MGWPPRWSSFAVFHIVGEPHNMRVPTCCATIRYLESVRVLHRTSNAETRSSGAMPDAMGRASRASRFEVIMRACAYVRRTIAAADGSDGSDGSDGAPACEVPSS